ncbi:MAG: hypothetical protein R6X13_08165 [bacterium]
MTSRRALLLVLLAGCFSITAGVEPPAAGPRFPRLEAAALDRSVVVLPDSAAGRVTLVGFGFKMELQNDLTKWLLQYAEEFENDSGFAAYEVPMMGNSAVVRTLRPTIERGMRRAIPRHQHRYVMPVFADYRQYSSRLGIRDFGVVHMFLLDRAGRIRWRGTGPPGRDGTEARAVFALARALANE